MTFLAKLKEMGFIGDIDSSLSSRMVMATDNSIYQVLPEAVLYPKNTFDCKKIFQLLALPEFHSVRVSPRGGGTGTNGQSLTSGIIIDTTRYMTEILEINIQKAYVRVQPGVVLDQLNDTLKPLGYFFAPSCSTSSRATLGGMIATDACGEGSGKYGRTSEHVLALSCLLVSGEVLNTDQALPKSGPLNPLKGTLLTYKAEIDRVFPTLKRFMTGYNLSHALSPSPYEGEGLGVRSKENEINLTALICGSEGTLAFVTEAKLSILPLPKSKYLYILAYPTLNEALKDAPKWLTYNPVKFEFLDETLVDLARKEPRFTHLIATSERHCLYLLEFTDPQNLAGEISDQSRIAEFWEMRKTSVGLLGNVTGKRKPIPFVEDTAVSPENLADYIEEFKVILDSYGLQYGIFGHPDVGCLHVRPALNLQADLDVKIMMEILQKVHQLLKKYGGVMWAEHGRGYRSSYTEAYFGPTLYQLLRKIKAAFDPHNQLNPGKIVTPEGSMEKIVQPDDTLRGDFDRQVPESDQQAYQGAFDCNGNGACFQYRSDSLMCPTWKATRDVRHSPKGRAVLLREWLRNRTPQFEAEVWEALNGCVSCKGCTTHCPIHVDIPELRTQFLNEFYQKNRRSLRDFLIKFLEKTLPIQFKFRHILNPIFANKHLFGLQDLPKLSQKSMATILKDTETDWAIWGNPFPVNAVIFIQDSFTSFYQSELVEKTIRLLQKLDKKVYILPFFENGKPLHIKGFLPEFKKIVKKNTVMLEKWATLNIPMLGLEPSIVITYRDEYKKVLGRPPKFTIQLLQEYLCTLPIQKQPQKNAFNLLGHCMESTSLWKEVYAKFGLQLTIIPTTCCGMAGIFGHETINQSISKKTYELSWEKSINPSQNNLATGFSCRSQVERFSGLSLQHPIEPLLIIMV